MAALLELERTTKRYGPTVALDGVGFELRPGEVHALLGENGAGKTTALGLMYGVIRPDEGQVRVDGEPVRLDSISHAQSLGISCVFQELSLAEGLSVAENIFAGHPPGRAGLIDWSDLRGMAEKLLSDFELEIDVRSLVRDLPAGARQVVEIAKALSLDARILLLDEPTSALSPDEKRSLFRLIRKLTERGLGIVYVSHHLSEVLDIADRITVLRDGLNVSCRASRNTSEARIVKDMVGSALDRKKDAKKRRAGGVALQLKDISVPDRLDRVGFDIREGEIVGLAGLLGSGAPAIGEVIAGLVRPSGGTMTLKGESYSPGSFREAIRSGIGFVPEERKTEGLFLDKTLRENLVSAALRSHSRIGILSDQLARRTSEKAIREYSIRTGGDLMLVDSLSGGNQQKVMLAKWLEMEPSLLIVNEPTKGVDIKSKRQIHEALETVAGKSLSVLVISSDFPELIAICDRIHVVRMGRIADTPGKRTEAKLIALASGEGGVSNPGVAA